ncbi:MAG: TIGR01906 family membrane protein [Anaerotignaceae bacterium]
MKVLKVFLGSFLVVAITIITLFTAVDLVAFKDKMFYRNQYKSNNIYENVAITEDDLMFVTDVFIEYLTNERDDLYVLIEIDGEETEFFNQREKDHMVDVKNLIVSGIHIRTYLIIFVCLIIFALKYFKENVSLFLAKSLKIGIPVMVGISALIGAIISMDFTKAFIIFHEIIFTNDLWLLDPATDRLISIVPEPFFMAIALRIVIIFAIAIAVMFIASIYIVKDNKNNNK